MAVELPHKTWVCVKIDYRPGNHYYTSQVCVLCEVCDKDTLYTHCAISRLKVLKVPEGLCCGQ